MFCLHFLKGLMNFHEKKFGLVAYLKRDKGVIMPIPKTAKGLSSQITRIRAHLSACKREYGFIDDGAGDRYYLFNLYYLLDDNRRSSEYIRWSQKQFPDDSGEPSALLCWALMLHRMGKRGEHILGRTMLSNIYLIPHLLGERNERVEMWHSSNWEEPAYMVEIPERVLDALTDEDKTWIREAYQSEPFQNVLKRHIEVNQALESLQRGEERSALIRELYSLKDSIE